MNCRFANTDAWDEELEDHSDGSQAFFRIFRLSLTHFPGAQCTPVAFSFFSSKSMRNTWRNVLRSLRVRCAGFEPDESPWRAATQDDE